MLRYRFSGTERHVDGESETLRQGERTIPSVIWLGYGEGVDDDAEEVITRGDDLLMGSTNLGMTGEEAKELEQRERPKGREK